MSHELLQRAAVITDDVPCLALDLIISIRFDVNSETCAERICAVRELLLEDDLECSSSKQVTDFVRDCVLHFS